MSALNVALNTIDAAAAEGDLAAHRLMAEQLELEAAGDPRRSVACTPAIAALLASADRRSARSRTTAHRRRAAR